jgi:hypothetical protein
MVRGHEGVDIRFALCIWITQCTSAPGQRLQSKMPNHGDVREHAPMPAIAIPKGMYRHDSILKADRTVIQEPNLDAQKRPFGTCGTAASTARSRTSMGLKEIVLSARTTVIVMNYPLYDGGVSERARRLIADGRLTEALIEYQRLAATGSALAKCVLAYLHLRDLPGAPRNVEAAKSLAVTALSREPGFANYVLSYDAVSEEIAEWNAHCEDGC